MVSCAVLSDMLPWLHVTVMQQGTMFLCCFVIDVTMVTDVCIRLPVLVISPLFLGLDETEQTDCSIFRGKDDNFI